MVRKKRKKILVLCPSPFGTAATQRLKYEQYFDLLNQEGYDMKVASFQTQKFFDIIYKEGYLLQKVFWVLIGYIRRFFDLFRIPLYDGVYISLWVTPFGLPIFEFLTTKLNSKVVYDLDDMIFVDVSHKAKGGRRLIDRVKGKNKSLYLMKNADYVIVCTPKLEQICKKLNDQVVDISSTFNVNRFIPKEIKTLDKPITIGWTGTQSTLQLLDLIEDVLVDISKIRNIRFLVVCNRKYELEGVNVEYRQWSDITEIRDLHEMDIGVYPIRNDEFSKGKSGLKALTYMAIGIPSVSTAWGANFRVIEDGVSGFLVESKDEWKQRLLELIDNIELRKKIGINGRKRVEKYFSLEANLPKYLKAFEATYK